MSQPRVVFAGTPEFALASLRALVEAGIRPLAVLTQPDRPSGRGRKLAPSPVKKYALDRGIDVLQPGTLKDAGAVRLLADLDPDALIVAAYGLILPQAVLDVPRRGCINVHASLLPKWRGAAPVQAAILAGDGETGISLMQMDAGLDTGPVYARAKISIGENATAGELHDRLAELGGALLVERLAGILKGTLTAEPQNDREASYAGKIRPDDARIDWARPASELARCVRAYNPVPGARFRFNGETVKCWAARTSERHDGVAGRVLSAGVDGIEVVCGQGSLVLTRLQRPGRKPVSAGEFAAQLDLADCSFE